MLTPQEFIQAWGKEGLFPFPNELLRDVVISDRDRLFLLEAGLPQQVLLPYDRDGFRLLFPGNPPGEMEGSEGFHLCEKVDVFRLLGVCWYKSYINIDESADGQIVCYAGENVFQMRDSAYPCFVNTSIPQFAECLLTCRLWGKRISDDCLDEEIIFFDTFGKDYQLYQDKVSSSINWLEDELRRIDPSIFADPNAHWLCVLEDIREMFWRV